MVYDITVLTDDNHFRTFKYVYYTKREAIRQAKLEGEVISVERGRA